MHTSVPFFFLASLVTLSTTSPIFSPLDSGSFPPAIRTYLSNSAINRGKLESIKDICSNIDTITIDAGALPPVSDGLKLWHVAIGRGTQNYSCPIDKGDAAAPTALGAVAKLYNVTCSIGNFGNKNINSMTDAIALQDKDANFGLRFLQSGNHYFPDIAATTATFNLNMGREDTNYGITFQKKVANVTAPPDAGKGQDGSAAVPWLKLSAPDPLPVGYELKEVDSRPKIKEVYRVNTAGGAAPKTCAGLVGTSFQKEYAAEYYFFHEG